MQKVYVLMGGFGETYVLGVFSSLKKAKSARAWVLENDMFYKENPDHIYIDTFELNGDRIE